MEETSKHLAQVEDLSAAGRALFEQVHHHGAPAGSPAALAGLVTACQAASGAIAAAQVVWIAQFAAHTTTQDAHGQWHAELAGEAAPWDVRTNERQSAWGLSHRVGFAAPRGFRRTTWGSFRQRERIPRGADPSADQARLRASSPRSAQSFSSGA